jgi:hypothetical protein
MTSEEATNLQYKIIEMASDYKGAITLKKLINTELKHIQNSEIFDESYKQGFEFAANLVNIWIK